MTDEVTFMTDDVNEYLAHYGMPRRSGRYPWGSGDNPYQNNANFLAYVEDLRKKGLTDTEIARGAGITTTQFRAMQSIAKNQKRKADEAQALRLKETGMSNVAIGKEMGINESSVRALLNPAMQDRADVLTATSNMLREQLGEKAYLDIGAGVENHLGISGTKLNTAVAILQDEGYQIHYVQVDQQFGSGKTTVKVLAPPGTETKDIYADLTQIKTVTGYSEDGGRSYLGIKPPTSVDSKRVQVVYADEGGADADGVIYIRPGVDDISLGGAKYAQVRIAVDGTHYLKGMAMYKDDLPDGVDLAFNTNKKSTGNKLDAMKPMQDDPDNPFGASIKRQRHYTDASGKEKLGAMNIVNEEGDWNDWSRNLSSQMLSKQNPALARQQLDITYAAKKAQFDEISSLTNPAVRKKLLESFADDADASAVHLKAAALPRQRTSVILPINSLTDTEIYAPNFRNGEKVALVRYPHGGIFEIPELTVNNRNPEARRALSDTRGHAQDAVGINSRVAARLSGADFDGDTVLVIPNNSKTVKTWKPLEQLKGFDPQQAYPGYEGMKPMSARTKQLKMGDVSNLITDMTIKGAPKSEIARAVKHSMVVIDAEKHKLNWKQSAIDNDITGLKKKYQARPDGSPGGAATLISRASSDVRVPERKPRPASEGGPVDRATGQKVYVPTGASYTNKQGQTVLKTTRSKRMAETSDAHTLSSGQPMEKVYADHANRLKALANEARKSAVNTAPTRYSPSAKKTYAPQVSSLTAKLNLALKNAPLERQAQLLADATVKAKRQANPDMEAADIKKIKGQALNEARARTGAGKQRVNITQDEWDAIQAGAISNNRLTQILNNADLDQVKKLASPRSSSVMSPAVAARARAMASSGYTQAEIAEALGVSPSTISDALS